MGHARAAAEVFEFAKTHGGTALLRIEDIDHTRCRPEFTPAIYRDLDWLGFDWPLPVRVQSQHRCDYSGIIINLIERGLAYACPLTRGDIKANRTPAPNAELPHGNALAAILQDTVRLPTPQLPFAIRLNLNLALDSLEHTELGFTELGPIHPGEHNPRPHTAPFGIDPIIARKDIACSYHIAVTHDDAAQGVTHVVRGVDLFEDTPLHVLIQKLMGWPTPLYYHHRLVTTEAGEKLSKRNLDTAIAALREAHQSPAHVLALAADKISG